MSREIYWKLEKKIVPELKYSQYRYCEGLQQLVPQNCRWLDLGCGHQMFAQWMVEEERELSGRAAFMAGIDYDWAGLRKNRYLTNLIRGRLETLPFADEQFDIVTANMVVEHIVEPTPILAEIRRILKPSGIFVFHTPNLTSPMIRLFTITPEGIKKFFITILEDRKEEDVFETFYRLNTPGAIRKHAAEAGLRVGAIQRVRTNAVSASLNWVALPELLVLRQLRRESLAWMRTNLIAVLEKDPSGAPEKQALRTIPLKNLTIRP